MTNRGAPQTPPNNYGSSHVTQYHGGSSSYQNDFSAQRGSYRGRGGCYRSHGQPATRSKAEWTPSPGSKNQKMRRQKSQSSFGDSPQYGSATVRQVSPELTKGVSNHNMWSPEKPDPKYHEHSSWTKTENPWVSKSSSRSKEDTDLRFEIRGSDMKSSGKDGYLNGMPEVLSNEICGFAEATNSNHGAIYSNYYLNKSDPQTKKQSANQVPNGFVSSIGTRRVNQKSSSLKSIISSSFHCDQDNSTNTYEDGPQSEQPVGESSREIDILQNRVAETGDSSVESDSLLSSSSTSQCNQSLMQMSRGSCSPTPEAMLLNSDTIDIPPGGDSPPSDDSFVDPEDIQDFVRCLASNDNVLFNPSANVGILPFPTQSLPRGVSEIQSFSAPTNYSESLPRTDVGVSQRETFVSGNAWRDHNREIMDDRDKGLTPRYEDSRSDSYPPMMSLKTTLNSALNEEPSSSSAKHQNTSAWVKSSTENDFMTETDALSANLKRYSEPPQTDHDTGTRDSKRGDPYKARHSASPQYEKGNPWKNKSRGLLGDNPDDAVSQLSEKVSSLDTRSQEEKRTELRRQQMFGRPSSFARSMEKSGGRGTGKVKFVKATALTQHFVNPQQKSLADRLHDIENQSPQSSSSSSANVEEWCRNFKSLYSLKNTGNQTYIDSHCHIDFLYKRYNLQKDCKFKYFNDKHFPYQPESFEGFVSVYCEPYAFQSFKSYPFLMEDRDVNCVAAFGIHPHSAHLYNDKVEKEMLIALDHPKCTALGEIGLDYSDRAAEAPAEVQKKVFIQQLKIALAKRKNVVLHCRDADDDMNEILKKYAPGITMHRHCFTENRKLLGYLLKNFPNMFIGFTNLISLKSADDPRQAAYEMPLERLLLETDAPYFLPPSVPTKYSHPAMAVCVAEKIAELKNTPLEVVMSHARENTRKMYNI